MHLGGNSVSGSGEAGSVWLKQLRPDLEVDWDDRLTLTLTLTLTLILPTNH